MSRKIGYALVGCGSFGQFCMNQYQEMEEVQLLAVSDCHRPVGLQTADRFGMEAYDVSDQMLSRQDVDIVHIASPPHTHYDLAMKALAAGKHVLCEKPLATTVAEGRKMLDAAADAKRLLAVNLIMRYDPLVPAVRKIIEQDLLGQPIHGFLENYAMDERLGPDHWFWDPRQSGGMFVEHGVHFFDLFESWLGRTEVLCSQFGRRPGDERIVEQVQCLCRHESNAMTSFYHGFHQPDRLDRQEFRIVFERGDLRMVEWLPTSLRIDAILLDRDAEAVAACLPNPKVRQIQRYDGEKRRAHSRHKHYEVDALYSIESDVGMPKQALYGHVLRELLRDQIRFILDPSHQRRLDETAGLRSLEVAAEATRLAS